MYILQILITWFGRRYMQREREDGRTNTRHDLRTVYLFYICRALSVYIWAGIAQWYSGGLRTGWSEVRIPAGVGNFSLHHRVQTGSGAHPASYPVGTRGFFPGGKPAGAGSWLHLYLVPRSSMRGAISSHPQYAFMARCSIKAQGQLYLY
jgi:hypothetical protein